MSSDANVAGQVLGPTTSSNIASSNLTKSSNFTCNFEFWHQIYISTISFNSADLNNSCTKGLIFSLNSSPLQEKLSWPGTQHHWVLTNLVILKHINLVYVILDRLFKYGFTGTQRYVIIPGVLCPLSKLQLNLAILFKFHVCFLHRLIRDYQNHRYKESLFCHQLFDIFSMKEERNVSFSTFCWWITFEGIKESLLWILFKMEDFYSFSQNVN